MRDRYTHTHMHKHTRDCEAGTRTMRAEPAGQNKQTARASKCTTKERLSRLPGMIGITDNAGRRWKVVDEDFDDDSSDSDAY